ncbi:hypothetical protein I7I53_01638 [Histoplasma capsulatum var. duboisii H88]|uniref:Uncharacterized protein n=1 Tax=Ajellomyces capsulatus (strain H88) TaxID=544711 RepID=A0A8A1LNY7_AJEC8|nr:hypothetical protein I7I53_01638 [Histoplasma capsulatum var. duboisii H88]
MSLLAHGLTLGTCCELAAACRIKTMLGTVLIYYCIFQRTSCPSELRTRPRWRERNPDDELTLYVYAWGFFLFVAVVQPNYF